MDNEMDEAAELDCMDQKPEAGLYGPKATKAGSCRTSGSRRLILPRSGYTELNGEVKSSWVGPLRRSTSTRGKITVRPWTASTCLGGVIHGAGRRGGVADGGAPLVLVGGAVPPQLPPQPLL